MEEVLIFWLMFLGIVMIPAMAYFVITRASRESHRREGTVPRGWLSEVESRRCDWAGQEEGVVVVDSVAPRFPPQAHVRS
jgi:hypothetical protein